MRVFVVAGAFFYSIHIILNYVFFFFSLLSFFPFIGRKITGESSEMDMFWWRYLLGLLFDKHYFPINRNIKYLLYS